MADGVALQNVRRDLGDAPAKHFAEAVALARDKEDDVDGLSAATKIFVDVLSAVPQDKTKSCGYAEVLLAYGRTLLLFLRKTAADSNPLLGGNVEAELPKGKHATAATSSSADPVEPAAAAPGDVAGNGSDEITPAPAAKADGANDGDDDEEDVDTEELTWEQLEHARLTFENLGPEARPRLADVFETLGDLLMESDQSEAAATEYSKAVAILLEAERPRLRVVSHLHYSRYLALRRDTPQPAVAALREAVAFFAKVADGDACKDGDDAVLKEMQDELRVFTNALAPALAGAAASVAKANGAAAASATVTIVQPKRRITPKQVAKKDDTEAMQPPAKKARVVESAAGGANSALEKAEHGTSEAKNDGELMEEGAKVPVKGATSSGDDSVVTKTGNKDGKEDETMEEHGKEAKKAGRPSDEADSKDVEVVDVNSKEAAVAAETVSEANVEDAQPGVSGVGVTSA